jgi:hypothetical protein
MILLPYDARHHPTGRMIGSVTPDGVSPGGLRICNAL